jgi:hypothetical protein
MNIVEAATQGVGIYSIDASNFPRKWQNSHRDLGILSDALARPDALGGQFAEKMDARYV